jgi:NADPH:quinone reductase-like Zn-dependent oxidoreductase
MTYARQAITVPVAPVSCGVGRELGWSGLCASARVRVPAACETVVRVPRLLCRCCRAIDLPLTVTEAQENPSLLIRRSGQVADERMRAVVHDKYGPPGVLRLAEVQRPVPKDDEVLIRIHATTVNRSDTALRAAEPFASRFVTGLRRPKKKILGSELAGEVAAVGTAVTEFEVGNQVFGVNPWKFGTHAEFVCMRESAALALKPAGATFEEAAAVCDGAILALGCLRSADLRKGKRILVYGASGSIGTAAVQLARYFDADITAVCNAKNIELVRSLGADKIIDYTQEDFTRNGQTYDVIFDAVGKHSFRRCKDSLNHGGFYLATDLWQNLVLAAWTARIGDKRVVFPIPPRYTKKDVLFLKQLMEAGKYRAVIDRCYPLEQVADATRYVETEQKTGNVVLTVS